MPDEHWIHHHMMLAPLCNVTPTLKLKSLLESNPAALDTRTPVNNFLLQTRDVGILRTCVFTFTNKTETRLHGPGCKNEAASTSSLALV